MLVRRSAIGRRGSRDRESRRSDARSDAAIPRRCAAWLTRSSAGSRCTALEADAPVRAMRHELHSPAVAGEALERHAAAARPARPTVPCPIDAITRSLGAAARRRRHADAQLVVLAAGRGERAGSHAELRATSATPSASGSAARSSSSRTPLRRASGGRRWPARRTGRSSRARRPRPARVRRRGAASGRSVARARARRRPARAQRAALEDREAGAAPPERAGHPDEVARAARRRGRRAHPRIVGPADDRDDRDVSAGAARDVAAGDRHAAVVRPASGRRARARAPRPVRSPRGSPSARYASPGSAPIAARSDSAAASARWPMSAGRQLVASGSGRRRPSCRPTSRRSGGRAPRPRRRRASARPRSALVEHALERLDQLELAHRGYGPQRWR